MGCGETLWSGLCPTGQTKRGPQAASDAGLWHIAFVEEAQACLAGSSAWPVKARQDCTEVVLGTRLLNGAKGWSRIWGGGGGPPWSGETGAGVRGPGVGWAGMPWVSHCLHTLDGRRLAVDLLCLCEVVGGYGYVSGGARWRHGDASFGVGALFVAWFGGHTFWEEVPNKPEKRKGGKLTPSPSLSLPEPQAFSGAPLFLCALTLGPRGPSSSSQVAGCQAGPAVFPFYSPGHPLVDPTWKAPDPTLKLSPPGKKRP